MPKLLKGNLVQIHMPRTGGTSLARQVGVKDYWNGLHDGPGQIPTHWKDHKIITTWRDPESWNFSMIEYLNGIGKHEQANQFVSYMPDQIESKAIDPTFGLFGGEAAADFKRFAKNSLHLSWYELYSDFYITNADIIIPINSLNIHINKSKDL